MADPTDWTGAGRRRFLRLLGGAGTAGTAALAGCASDEGDGGDPYEGWLSDASGFDGEPVDETGASEVTVDVGAGDGFAYAPAAVRVSPGTTVVWEWTGKGSQHNVVAEDDSYESPYYRSVGRTFSNEFQDPGVSKYFCSPHRNLGMKGVVEVVEG
ncbi:halocyanin domain-containing protein [Halorarum halophilum]|uniref:Halocyanin domain-containing protein n=1 Tax=Halorarum halophilum TaxID=2743090 RepID=A0A7D5GKQ9_9EURY|nr:halocyanin domain-containing protein [Halobaculum halophilum]QLG27467.1 halocyanin domain-containing protein [Halobaculum halophilum]